MEAPSFMPGERETGKPQGEKPNIVCWQAFPGMAILKTNFVDTSIYRILYLNTLEIKLHIIFLNIFHHTMTVKNQYLKQHFLYLQIM